MGEFQKCLQGCMLNRSQAERIVQARIGSMPCVAQFGCSSAALR